MKYCLPDIPSVYWINYIKYKCRKCNHVFDLYIPKGNEIVKYEEVNGTETRWLPAYGKGGYLDLMCKLIPNFQMNSEITMKIAKDFNNILSQYTEPSTSGNKFTISESRHVCERCNARELTILNEQTLKNPDIEWLKVSCELMK